MEKIVSKTTTYTAHSKSLVEKVAFPRLADAALATVVSNKDEPPGQRTGIETSIEPI